MGMADSYDVVIVGGGPAGCYAAKVAADHALGVLVVEKDPEIGLPVRCAEGVGHDGLTEFFEADPRWVVQRVERFRFVAPDGCWVDLAGEQHGWVLDRATFDAHIAELAREAGAEVLTRTAAVGLIHDDGGMAGVRLVREGREQAVKCRLVIGADGVESRVGRWAGLDTACSLHDMESCTQYLMSDIEVDAECACLYFGRDVAPGGYAWVFPKGAGRANVGLGISGEFGGKRHAQDHLDAFVEQNFPHGTVLRRTAGGVPCSGGLKRIVGARVMLVGDAAHQANPISGGGIVNALKAARIAGRVAAEAIQEDNVCAERLAEYQSEWSRLLGRVHRSFHRIKERVFGLSDEKLNGIARQLNALEPEKRTLGRTFMIALRNQPQLLGEVARLFAGEVLERRR